MDELDLEELKTMFLEECREHVDTLERGLLEMAQADQSADLLNEVFRAAHSIKGGGATFGFADLAELTHHMETLLDQMRSGERAVSDEDIELLLESLDVVRELMESLGNEDHPNRTALQARLEEAVGSAEPAAPAAADTAEPEPEALATQTWQVIFEPKLELMQRGNDPLLMLRELARLGDISVTPMLQHLPDWNGFDPKCCYVSWIAILKGAVDEATIAEIFEWVEFDCTVTILAMAEEDCVSETAEQSDAEPDTKAAAETAEPVAQPEAVAKEAAADAAPKAEAKAAAAPPAKAAASGGASSEASIRVSTDKIDELINLVGELVINQSMLSGLSAADGPLDAEQLRERLSELERNTRQLQEGVMRVRMLPLSMGFGRLPRLVRDLSRKLDKAVDLVVEGADTEIDKTVLEQMMDPLVHLVRNAVDHGLETRAERAETNKRETGELRLSAYHRSGSVVIEIADDGKGIDPERILNKAIERGIVRPDESLSENEIHRLIFAPGFSTAEVVSDVSGRGVGMDVVRRNIMELGGQVDIESSFGSGTKVTIRLPLTLAILDGQLVSCAEQTFVIPLASIIETLESSQCKVSGIAKSGSVFQFRDEYLPLIDLRSEFELEQSEAGPLIVVIESHGLLYGLAIDRVLGQQQIVIKALEDNYQAVDGISGATIMSDGSVALIIDPTAFAQPTGLSSAA